MSVFHVSYVSGHRETPFEELVFLACSFFPMQKLSDEGSDEFHMAANLAISCINDHKKYYEKVKILCASLNLTCNTFVIQRIVTVNPLCRF